MTTFGFTASQKMYLDLCSHDNGRAGPTRLRITDITLYIMDPQHHKIASPTVNNHFILSQFTPRKQQHYQ